MAKGRLIKPGRATLTERLERGDLTAAECPSRIVLQHLTSRWGVLVFIALRSGRQRFSDLRRKIEGVSERMLAKTLRGMEADGIVLRHDFKVVPPHVEYELTPLGVEAAQKVLALADWIEERLPNFIDHWGGQSPPEAGNGSCHRCD